MNDAPKTTGNSEQLYAQHVGQLSKRFERALEATGYERALIFSGRERYVSRDDQAYPYRAEPYFAQWAPLRAAHGSVIEIRPGFRPKLVFVQQEDFWYLPPEAPSGSWIEHFEIEMAGDADSALESVASERVRTAAIGEPGAELPEQISVNDPSLLARLDFDRAEKTSYEVECMRLASEAGVRGHRAVAEAFGSDATEFSLSHVFCSATAQRETELPYPSIVALNEHASVLHYQNQLAEGPAVVHSLLIDAGASHCGYASDITRSYAAETGAYSELIAAMEALQQTLCAEVSSGVDFVALNERAHRLLAEVMHEHGLIECGADDAYESGLTRVFLPHGLGHLLGLQVHDAGGHQISPDGGLRAPPPEHPFLRLTRQLAPGFVLTIEPGIYFIPSLLAGIDESDRRKVRWPAVAALLPYGGIRIEDNLLVELHGARNLTREAYAAAG